MKNAPEKSQRSFGGKSDEDEAQGLVSGLDASSNAPISSRALNGQNAERSDANKYLAKTNQKGQAPAKKLQKTSFNRHDEAVSGSKMQFELFNHKNQKGQFDGRNIEEQANRYHMNFPSGGERAAASNVAIVDFGSPNAKGFQQHGRTYIATS